MNPKVKFWYDHAEVLEQSAMWLAWLGETERANERLRAASVCRKRAEQEAEASN